MKTLFPIVIITAAIALIEIPSLLEHKLIKDLFIFTGLLLFTFILSVLKGLDVNIPNPFDWLTFIFNPMTKAIEKIIS